MTTPPPGLHEERPAPLPAAADSAADAKRRRPTLVVGASGQLGSRIVLRLAAAGRPVRALVRPTSRCAHLRLSGVDLVTGDLRDAASIDAACRGVGVVIATANAVAPVQGSSFAAVEGQGYTTLIRACQAARCDRFVFVSVPVTVHDAQVPLFRHKRSIEQRLYASGLPYAVLRPGPFMDDWFALIGSRLPARGDPAALIDRPWPFLQTFIGAVGGLIERRGLALVPGSAATRQAFIGVDDVADCVIAAAADPWMLNATRDLAGPERLSWREVATLFAALLGRPVRVLPTPGALFRLQQLVMRPFSEAASNIMGLNWLAATTMPLADSGGADGTAARLGVRLTRAEDFLRSKAALPA